MLNLLKPTRITLCNDFSLHYLDMAAVNEDRLHGVEGSGAKVYERRVNAEQRVAVALVVDIRRI